MLFKRFKKNKPCTWYDYVCSGCGEKFEVSEKLKQPLCPYCYSQMNLVKRQ